MTIILIQFLSSILSFFARGGAEYTKKGVLGHTSVMGSLETVNIIKVTFESF